MLSGRRRRAALSGALAALPLRGRRRAGEPGVERGKLRCGELRDHDCRALVGHVRRAVGLDDLAHALISKLAVGVERHLRVFVGEEWKGRADQRWILVTTIADTMDDLEYVTGDVAVGGEGAAGAAGAGAGGLALGTGAGEAPFGDVGVAAREGDRRDRCGEERGEEDFHSRILRPNDGRETPGRGRLP